MSNVIDAVSPFPAWPWVLLVVVAAVIVLYGLQEIGKK